MSWETEGGCSRGRQWETTLFVSVVVCVRAVVMLYRCCCVFTPAGSGRWGTWAWRPAWCCTEPETRVCSGWWDPPRSWRSGGRRSRTSRRGGRSWSACCFPLSWTQRRPAHDQTKFRYVQWIIINMDQILVHVYTLTASSSGLASLDTLLTAQWEPCSS